MLKIFKNVLCVNFRIILTFIFGMIIDFNVLIANFVCQKFVLLIVLVIVPVTATIFDVGKRLVVLILLIKQAISSD